MVNLGEITIRPRPAGLIGAAPYADRRIGLAKGVFDSLVDPQRAPLGSKSHHRDHWQRMLVNSATPAFRRGEINLPLLQIAVILHDVGVFYSQDPVHGSRSAQLIRPHLAGIGLTQVEVERVCSIVRAHDGRDFNDQSAEAIALRALDALDAFGEIGVFRFLEIYYRRGLRPPEIFVQALRGLTSKGASISGLWFEQADLARIQAALARTQETFARASGEAHGSDLSIGAAGILDEFLAIDWDLNRLPELLDGTGRPLASQFVRHYFADLQLAWLAWQNIIS